MPPDQVQQLLETARATNARLDDLLADSARNEERWAGHLREHAVIGSRFDRAHDGADAREGRVRDLERDRDKLLGVLIAASAAGGLISWVLGLMLDVLR